MSGFLKDKGNYVGGTVSVLWTSVAIYSAYSVSKMDNIKVPNKKYHWIGPGIIFLLVLIANGYYFANKNNGDEEYKKSVRSNYANITLIPVYLVVVALVLFLLTKMR
jgi:hypothetical protein